MSWMQQVCCRSGFLLEAGEFDGFMEHLARRFHVRSSWLFDADTYELLDLNSFGQAQEASDDLSVLLLSPGLSAICEPGLFGVDIVVEYVAHGPSGRKLVLIGLGTKTRLSSERKAEILEAMEQVALPAEKYAAHDGEEPARSQAFRQRCDLAQVLATFLSCHPRVSHVEYFGLKDCKSRKLAERIWRKGFTPYLQLELSPLVDLSQVVALVHDDPLLSSRLSLKPVSEDSVLLEVADAESASQTISGGVPAEGPERSSQAQKTALRVCAQLDRALCRADSPKAGRP